MHDGHELTLDLLSYDTFAFLSLGNYAECSPQQVVPLLSFILDQWRSEPAWHEEKDK